MAHLRLQNVSVTFPVIVNSAKSLLGDSLRSLNVGGRISAGGDHRVGVEAMSDITLELKDGDRLGLLGHNGAGKSTLLRTCAGIYRPSEGVVSAEGRISTIFELTAGMNWETTGRENIALVLVCLGTSRRQIEEQTLGIIEFTELGHYIDMPVRTYSSGMLARLAFAIATASSPDIMLLDEVIAAGDAGFRERANQRMAETIYKSGILVMASHSNQMLRQFCNRGAVLEHGQIAFLGAIDAAIAFNEAKLPNKAKAAAGTK